MSSKDCGHHHDDDRRRELLRRVFAGILIFIILILIIIFLIWIILKPTKPRFTIQDATLYVFNSSSTNPSSPSPIGNKLTTTIQVTLTTFNPNERIGILYEELDVFATYQGTQITLPYKIPRAYQDHREQLVWSPIISGDAVPVSSYVLSSIQQEEIAGETFISVKASGRVKWKVGTWVSGSYHIDVNCPSYIRFNSGGNNGIGSLIPLKVQLEQVCAVDV
ncbi:hypothetical protein RIF29_27489 [Crotalaria pallida]|uniref:Late embryogenesis abundant protein LEA-2 subgroup domain-containing protein n=1 Tax=Crotalaria pallida TaxID=3830 RepID=A0AAN9EQ38_CROPI